MNIKHDFQPLRSTLALEAKIKSLKGSNLQNIIDVFIKPFQQYFSLNCATSSKNDLRHHSSYFCSLCHSPLLIMNVFILVFFTDRPWEGLGKHVILFLVKDARLYFAGSQKNEADSINTS